MDPPETRCDHCWAALAAHGDPEVKEALLAEPDVPDWVVEQLRGDSDDYIAVLAESRAARTLNE